MIFGFVGAVAAEALVLAHRFDVCGLGTFRLELAKAVGEERRIHRDGEAVIDELRNSDLQPHAVNDDDVENDMIRCTSGSVGLRFSRALPSRI